MEQINVYGDTHKNVADSRGHDIASQRADDLDNMAVQWCRQYPESQVLDLACGLGGQSLRMANADAHVTGVDIIDMSDEFKKIKVDSTSKGSVQFKTSKMEELDAILDENQFNLVMCQRAIHYLPRKDALKVLKSLKLFTNSTGRLYISCSGINSELGHNYVGNEKDVNDRFDKLSDINQEKHEIRHPVCLYSKEEFQSLLVEAGWSIVNIFISPFGNIKAIARKEIS